MKLTEEKKKYILELLNPLLEELVADCIHRMPSDAAPFMLEWMENKHVFEEDNRLSPEDRDRLSHENMLLRDEIRKAQAAVQSIVKMSTDSHTYLYDEDEEEDDELLEPPVDFDQPMPPKARQSVSAEAYGEWNTKKAFVAPIITKTEAQKNRLKTVLSASFLFFNLDAMDFGIVIGAMKEVVAEPGKRVFNQGDSGDFLFVIESGKLNCLIQTPDGKEKCVKTCEAGDVFGELALLYNCPRAASVECKEKAVLWQLDRDTFSHIVKESAQKKRNRYDAFLAKVPLLLSMDSYERAQLADALRVEIVTDGVAIVNEGDVGNKFYILEEGHAVAMKNGSEVMSYAAGDYFGELALIQNQPRAATVIAKGLCKLLSIDSGSFKRLLRVSELLDRSTKYH